MLQPGDYQIPFEFTLPMNIPATIMYKNCHDHDKPKAKLLYSVKSVLHTHDKKEMKYKQLLVVHEPPVEFLADHANTHTTNLSTWFCRQKGKGSISAQFQKNVFYSNEVAWANVSVNNAESQLDITEVEF